jgi:hypothetical protein
LWWAPMSSIHSRSVWALDGCYSLNDIPQARAGFGHNFFHPVPILRLERQGSIRVEENEIARFRK